MKKAISCVIVLFILFGGSQAFSESGPRIKLSEEYWDFGQLKEPEIAEKVFLVENTGDRDLVIKTILTTCGCVTTEISSNNIGPQSSEELKAIYNTKGKSFGRDSKDIYVVSNDLFNPRMRITIEATIISDEDYSRQDLLEKGGRK